MRVRHVGPRSGQLHDYSIDTWGPAQLFWLLMVRIVIDGEEWGTFNNNTWKAILSNYNAQ